MADWMVQVKLGRTCNDTVKIKLKYHACICQEGLKQSINTRRPPPPKAIVQNFSSFTICLLFSYKLAAQIFSVTKFVREAFLFKLTYFQHIDNEWFKINLPSHYTVGLLPQNLYMLNARITPKAKKINCLKHEDAYWFSIIFQIPQL
jgi:hypothetical protein